jgi:hypothetical protein
LLQQSLDLGTRKIRQLIGEEAIDPSAVGG